MNMNNTLRRTSSTASSPFVAACATTCEKLLRRLQNLKTALLDEFGRSVFGQEHLLQLALNEAEALAHETGFPLLTFPTLAREKVQAVAAWRLHQQSVRHPSFGRLAA
jgi:hypothetical protein